MNTQTHFTIFTECQRCSGFKRAFAPFHGVNGGRCLRCNGALRDVRHLPMARLAAIYPDARAVAIRSIKEIIDMVGVAGSRDADGKRLSDHGFAYHCKGDDASVFCAALSIAPADVRVRGWAALAAKCRNLIPDRAEKLLGEWRTLAAKYAGIAPEQVGAWLGETQTEVAVAA